MWQKVCKIVLAASIFLSFGLLIPMTQANAVGVDTAVKLVGGKQVVRALAEKTGMALSPRQLDNVVDLIEKKTYDGDTEVIEWVNKANLVKGSPTSTPATKTGFKKYVLDPVMWLTGLDLIFEAVNAFKDGYDNSTPVDLYKKCLNPVLNAPGNIIYMYDSASASKDYWFLLVTAGAMSVTLNADGGATISATMDGTAFKLYSQTMADYPVPNYSGTKYQSLSASSYVTGQSFNLPSDGQVRMGFDGFDDDCDSVQSVQPEETDVVNITNVNNETKNTFDNDTYDNDTTYNVEIELPDDNNDDGDDGRTWNDKDVNIDVEVEVEVQLPDPDTDGDGTTDSNDSDDDNDGIPDDEDDGSPSKGEPVDWLVVVDDEIPIHEKFFLEMADMGQKIEDMYNGVVHFFDVSIDGFTTLTNGMTGFVSFLDSFFDWLPSEFRALLGSGFTLGVVAFFLRR